MHEISAREFHSKVIMNPTPVVLMFHAVWCPKCAMMHPVIEDIAKKYKRQVQFFTINIDREPDLARKYGAAIVPTFVFFQKEKTLAIWQGMISESQFERGLKKIFTIC